MAFKAVVTVAVVAVAAVSGHIFACNAPGKWLFLFLRRRYWIFRKAPFFAARLYSFVVVSSEQI